MAAILKILNGGYHKDHVMYPHICYDLLHSWSPINKCSCKYSHVDQSYNNFKFLVAAILKNVNGGYPKNQVICMMCYIAVHQYTQFHANIHMQTKVITILNFRWRPFYYRHHVICPQIWYDL